MCCKALWLVVTLDKGHRTAVHLPYSDRFIHLMTSSDLLNHNLSLRNWQHWALRFAEEKGDTCISKVIKSSSLPVISWTNMSWWNKMVTCTMLPILAVKISLCSSNASDGHNLVTQNQVGIFQSYQQNKDCGFDPPLLKLDLCYEGTSSVQNEQEGHLQWPTCWTDIWVCENCFKRELRICEPIL